MGGFTRPSDLRTSNWFPGGAYVLRKKNYEYPLADAYESHTVFLLESRYQIRYGVGRVEAPEYVYGVCREQDLPAVLKRYNSRRTHSHLLEIMDNARWPWGPQKSFKRVKWWTSPTDLQATLEELGMSSEGYHNVAVVEEDDDDDGGEPPVKLKKTVQSKSKRPKRVTPLPEDSSLSVRAFHSASAHSVFDPLAAFELSGNLTKPLVLGGTPGDKRGLLTTASFRAAAAEWDFARANALIPNQTFIPRAEYLGTLDELPFWRPLMTLTVSTRPIALTLLRLAKGMTRGTPYHATISNDDKKCRLSFASRMRRLRLDRMRELTVELAQVLAGRRGGVIGIRFQPHVMGRGIGGEGLADPIPRDKRVIGVGIGNWYSFAADLKELYRLQARDEIPAPDGKPGIEVFGLDDLGRRIAEDGTVVPWRMRQETAVDKLRREPWVKEYQIIRACIHRLDQVLVRMAREGKQTSSQVGAEATPAPAAASVKLAGKTAAKAAAATNTEEDEDEDEDEELDEDDHLELDAVEVSKARNPSAPPIVRIRAHDASLLGRLAGAVKDDETGQRLDITRPLEFVIIEGEAPSLGPQDVEGRIPVDDFPVALNNTLARQVLQRRLDAIYLAKPMEIAMLLTARQSNKVEYALPGERAINVA
jgi:hypothetical protein